MRYPGSPQRRHPSAANLDPSWIGIDADALFTEATGRDVHVVNDADAAGLAEMRFGAGRDRAGLVLLLTFGTGIGSGLFLDGMLVPNTELGHLEIDGDDAESKAAASARDRDDLSWTEWAPRVQHYLRYLVRLFSPSDHRRRRGEPEGRQVAAAHRRRLRGRPGGPDNEAGIVGAALVGADRPIA